MIQKIVIGIGIVAVVFAVIILSGIGTNPIDMKTGMSDPHNSITNTTITGEKINVYLGTIGNITFNATIPESPASMRVYKGVFQQGDLVDVSPESSKDGGNIPSETDAPIIAKKVLENYGGLPPDALYMGASTNYAELVNRSTLEVIKRIPKDTSVWWWRKIDGKRIVGGGDSIQVLLGDNGAPLWIYKRWRTYTPLDKVTIIPLEKAIAKLGQGEVINPSLGAEEDVYVYGITLGYYAKGLEQPEVTLEPVWIFYGNTSRSSLMFYVYAIQFANFTATPTTGKVPLTVTFTDTSDASPVKWLWNFGDGITSTEHNPVHTYTTAGTYNVSLRAWNDLGSDTMVKMNCVVAGTISPPIANFTATPRYGAFPLSVTFSDTSGNTPGSWKWEYKTATTDWTQFSTEQNPVFSFPAEINQTVYSIHLTATNTAGSGNVIRNNYIIVKVSAHAALTVTPVSGNAPLTVHITDQSTGTPPSDYTWDYGDGTGEDVIL